MEYLWEFVLQKKIQLHLALFAFEEQLLVKMKMQELVYV
jgi:hypothetical protein